MSIARQRASRAPAIFRATAARRSRATCSADGRTGFPSSAGFVMLGNQVIQQANAKTRSPALIDVGFRRPHRRSRDVEMRPWRVIDEALQELRRSDRTAIAGTGVLHIGKLRIALLVVFP